MRFLVFMSDNRHLDATIQSANYNSLVACINYEYCKKWNHDFIYYRPYLDADSNSLYNCKDPTTKELRHAAWSKLLSSSLAHRLPYDYIVYIDSDCIFKDFNISLTNFLGHHYDKDIIFLNNKPYNYDKPCSGFYAIKTSVHGGNFLLDWYAVNMGNKNRNHAWEQDALWPIYARYNVGIIDSWMFCEVEDQFLRHVGTCECSNRIPYFRAFIDRHSFNYANTIQQIKVVEFNTNEHSEIDWQKYLSRYPDLGAAGIHTREWAIRHWIHHGRAEGRIPF